MITANDIRNDLINIDQKATKNSQVIINLIMNLPFEEFSLEQTLNNYIHLAEQDVTKLNEFELVISKLNIEGLCAEIKKRADSYREESKSMLGVPIGDIDDQKEYYSKLKTQFELLNKKPQYYTDNLHETIYQQLIAPKLRQAGFTEKESHTWIIESETKK